MEKELVIANICSMLKTLEDGQIRAVYMVVKEIYELLNYYNYTSSAPIGQQKRNKNNEK